MLAPLCIELKYFISTKQGIFRLLYLFCKEICAGTIDQFDFARTAKK